MTGAPATIQAQHLAARWIEARGLDASPALTHAVARVFLPVVAQAHGAEMLALIIETPREQWPALMRAHGGTLERRVA